MSDLASLIERLEKATGPDRELDLAIACFHLGKPATYFLVDELGRVEFGAQRPYTASLDAALTLVPEGYEWEVGSATSFRDYWSAVNNPYFNFDSRGPNPALALCIAALRSRANEGERV